MIKINHFEAENVKRIKAVKIKPTPAGLTIIGGKNRQGKTSVLDTIAWALGGNGFKPSEAKRRESTIPPYLKVELSNGLVVERKGKNSTLTVTDPQGVQAGQTLLNSFIEELALDLPKFMAMNSKDKAQTLLQVIGVGDELAELEKKEEILYNKRRATGQVADQKEKYAKEMPTYKDVPDELTSITDLVAKQKAILEQNRENEKQRNVLQGLNVELDNLTNNFEEVKKQLADFGVSKTELTDTMTEAKAVIKGLIKEAETAIENIKDESTDEIEAAIASAEEINEKVRANQDRIRAKTEAREFRNEYNDLTKQIEDTRQAQLALLEGATLPLEGLSIKDSELTYKGDKWDNMAGSDQLKVATAIVRGLKPECGFVLLDKLEQMDLDTLEDFGKWLEQEGLQAIATRVSTGAECTIIIEDGYALEDKELPKLQEPVQEPKEEPKWKKGEF